jgi:hypothetical protein
MKRQLTICFLFFVLFFALGKVSNKRTHGFSISKTRNNFPSTSPYLTQKNNIDEELIRTLLKQRFHYYKRGAQSFVFLSEDGKTVLKIFNNRLKRLNAILSLVPWSTKNTEALKQRWNETSESYYIAKTMIPEETGLIYAHLNKESIAKQDITLIDPLGIEHQLSTLTTSFLLQKHSDLIYPVITQLMKDNKIDEAKKTIAALVFLQRSLHKKGISNHDPSIRKNVGILDGRCITVDVGRFVLQNNQKDDTTLANDSKWVLRRFRKWIAKTHPALLSYLETELNH